MSLLTNRSIFSLSLQEFIEYNIIVWAAFIHANHEIWLWCKKGTGLIGFYIMNAIGQAICLVVVRSCDDMIWGLCHLVDGLVMWLSCHVVVMWPDGWSCHLVGGLVTWLSFHLVVALSNGHMTRWVMSSVDYVIRWSYILLWLQLRSKLSDNDIVSARIEQIREVCEAKSSEIGDEMVLRSTCAEKQSQLSDYQVVLF